MRQPADSAVSREMILGGLKLRSAPRLREQTRHAEPKNIFIFLIFAACFLKISSSCQCCQLPRSHLVVSRKQDADLDELDDLEMKVRFRCTQPSHRSQALIWKSEPVQ